jgi:hypothetical protein
MIKNPASRSYGDFGAEDVLADGELVGLVGGVPARTTESGVMSTFVSGFGRIMRRSPHQLRRVVMGLSLIRGCEIVRDAIADLSAFLGEIHRANVIGHDQRNGGYSRQMQRAACLRRGDMGCVSGRETGALNTSERSSSCSRSRGCGRRVRCTRVG